MIVVINYSGSSTRASPSLAAVACILLWWWAISVACPSPGALLQIHHHNPRTILPLSSFFSLHPPVLPHAKDFISRPFPQDSFNPSPLPSLPSRSSVIAAQPSTIEGPIGKVRDLLALIAAATAGNDDSATSTPSSTSHLHFKVSNLSFWWIAMGLSRASVFEFGMRI
jgi:hypothetical protein